MKISSSFQNYNYSLKFNTSINRFLSKDLNSNSVMTDSVSFKGNKEKISKIKADLSEAIKNKDTEAIFDYFQIGFEKLQDGTYEISSYNQPDKDVTFSDLGIDEDELLKNVKTIIGNANFSRSSLTKFPLYLTSIQGDAILRGSKIKSLRQLQIIGGNADLSSSYLSGLGNLKTIGGSAEFQNSKITNLGNLALIGGNAFFKNSQVKTLNDLQVIGGCADFNTSMVVDLGKLKYVGSYCDFENSKIESLNKLQIIGGRANFKNSMVKDLGRLAVINGKVTMTKQDYDRLVDSLAKVYIRGSLSVE